MEGLVIIDGRDGAGMRHCHWSWAHSSPAVVPELLFAGMMLQFLACVGQLIALLQRQSFCSRRNAWSPFDARGGR